MNIKSLNRKHFSNRKIYQFINIVGLTVAFAVFIFIALFVNNEINFDKFVEHGDRIYRIEEGEFNQVPGAVSTLAKQNLDEIENSVVIKAFDNHWLKYKKDFFEVEDFSFAENSIFEMFSIPFILGNPETALDAPYKIVLSESEAKKIFGNRNPIGEQVNFKNEDYYTVSGVIKDLPDFHLPVKAIASYKSVETKYSLPEYNWYWSLVTYVKLKDNQNPDFVESKLNTILSENEKWKESGSNVSFRPFIDIYLANDTYANDETKHGNASLLIILTVIGVFILLIASINYINLSVSHGIRKLNELSVRRILGSSEWDIVFREMVRSFKTVFISMLLAFGIVILFLNSYENLIGKELNVASSLNMKTGLILVASILTLSIIYGVLPALILLKTHSFQSLKNSLSKAKHSGFNSGLVTFQYALSIILICSTLITFKQLSYIKNSSLGLNKDQVVSLELTPELRNNTERFKALLLENPTISGVSFISDDITQFNEYSAEIPIDNQSHIFNFAYIDPEFIPLMEIEMLQGDNFSHNIKSQATEGYIANDAAWRILKNSSLKDQNYNLDDKSLMGVVKDFHFQSLHSKIKPLIFLWGKNENYHNVLIKLTGGDISQAVKHIDETFKGMDPESLCKYHFVDDAFNNLYQAENVMGRLLGIFTIFAIFIASLGLISLSSMSIESRIKEIGVRKVNGARVTELLSMLNKDFIKWIGIAFFIALPVSWIVMHKWLESFVYKTSLSWWIFAVSGIMALGIALLTISWQTWKAATRNPVEALRYE